MARYIPRNVPSDSADIPGFLSQELQNIAFSLSTPNEFALLNVSYVPPAKPVAGMVVLADGTSWNPGSGAGFYGYSSGAWRFLG